MLLKLLIFFFLWTDASRAEQLVDRIVAIVNGVPVLMSEVQKKVDSGPLVVISEYPADENSPIYNRALNDAINWKMATLKADELSIEIDDAEVEKEIEQTQKRFNLTREQLKQRLVSDGSTFDEYFEDTRDFLRLKRFQGRVIQPLIKITDRDLETHYLKKSGSVSEAVDLKLKQILVSVSGDSSKDMIAAKEKLAYTVYQKLSDGAPFEELARVYSDDPKARENGGELPLMKLVDLNKAIQSEVGSLEPGQFTKPIKTGLGWHIFLLEEKKFSTNKNFLANKTKLQEELFVLEVQEQTKRWVMDQRRRSKITIIEP
jgi:peptidyl-prolyl cis-trans isomerase SurA